MSEMKMNYIFIEKETQDSISMCEQIAELLGVEDSKMKSGNLPMSGFICLQDVEVFYEISGKSGVDQYFLELSTKARVNRAVIALQTLDDTIYQFVCMMGFRKAIVRGFILNMQSLSDCFGR